MNITQIEFCYPREARYSYDPANYSGGSIEEYGHVAAELAQGDRILHDGLLWTVAEIQEFSPAGHDNSFQVAVATLDGKAPQRDGWDGEPPILYVHMTEGKCLTWGMAEKPQYLPSAGDSPDEFPGHEVRKVWEFEAAHSSPSGFEQVLVCECAAVEAAIAA